MTFLEICQQLAQNVGLRSPERVFGSTLRDWSEAIAQSNLVGEELARRVDFGGLTEKETFFGSVSGATTHQFGEEFSRITSGVGVSYEGRPVRPLTRPSFRLWCRRRAFPAISSLRAGTSPYGPI